MYETVPYELFHAYVSEQVNDLFHTYVNEQISSIYLHIYETFPYELFSCTIQLLCFLATILFSTTFDLNYDLISSNIWNLLIKDERTHPFLHKLDRENPHYKSRGG